jgi:hypothetical protein
MAGPPSHHLESLLPAQALLYYSRPLFSSPMNMYLTLMRPYLVAVSSISFGPGLLIHFQTYSLAFLSIEGWMSFIHTSRYKCHKKHASWKFPHSECCSPNTLSLVRSSIDWEVAEGLLCTLLEQSGECFLASAVKNCVKTRFTSRLWEDSRNVELHWDIIWTDTRSPTSGGQEKLSGL